MAALTILENRIYKSYPEITSKIIKSAKFLHRQGTQATIHWIPGHVDLDGNEHADRQANIATSLNEVLHAEQIAGTYSHLIKSHFFQQFRRIATENTSPLQKWYEKTTVPDLNFLPKRQAETQLRRLHFWVFTKQYGTNNHHNAICPHCQQDFTPIHCLINCPAHPTYRQRLKGQLTPRQHSWTDVDIAASSSERPSSSQTFFSLYLRKVHTPSTKIIYHI